MASLVAVHAASLCVTFFLSPGTDVLADWRELSFEVLTLSQLGLLVVWAMLGRTAWFVRWPVVLACTGSYWALLCRRQAEVHWAVALAVFVGCTIFLLAIARACGVRLVDRNSPPAAFDLQFTMWYLLAWLTVAAVPLGLLRLLRYDRFAMNLRLRFFDAGEVFGFTAEVCSYSLLIVLTAAMLLTEGRLGRRLAALALLAPLLGVGTWHIWSLQGWHDPMELAAHLSANVLLVAIAGGSLAVVRSCGERLTRRL